MYCLCTHSTPSPTPSNSSSIQLAGCGSVHCDGERSVMLTLGQQCRVYTYTKIHICFVRLFVVCFAKHVYTYLHTYDHCREPHTAAAACLRGRHGTFNNAYYFVMMVGNPCRPDKWKNFCEIILIEMHILIKKVVFFSN